MAKLQAYGVTKDALKRMLSYQSQHKQCIKNGGSLSLLKIILSRVPQGSVLRLTLFNIYLNDIFLILGQDLHNFADDNTITTIGKTIDGLVHDLETKSEGVIEWMYNNNMITNPRKFKAILLSKKNIETVGTKFQIREKVIYSNDTVDLLGVAIDNQLNFEYLISEICRKGARLLNSLKRLGSYIPLESRKILSDSVILSNFNYCPLVWYFSKARQVLRFVHNDFETDYPSLLKSNKSVHVTREFKRIRYYHFY